MAALTDYQLEPLWKELNLYPGITPDVDTFDMPLYAKAVRRYCRDTHDLWAVMGEIRRIGGNGRNGRRPTVAEFEAISREFLGVEEATAHIKPIEELRAGWRKDADQAAQAARDFLRAPGEASPRDVARAAIHALAQRTSIRAGERWYSYTPEEFKPVGPGDTDPLQGVPREEWTALFDAAKKRTPSRHPRLLRDIACKVWREMLAAEESSERAKGEESEEIEGATA